MKENLKVLMINGSPKANGNTAIALKEMENIFKENGVEVETVVIGNKAVRGCIACGSCYEKGKWGGHIDGERALLCAVKDAAFTAKDLFYIRRIADHNEDGICILNRLRNRLAGMDAELFLKLQKLFIFVGISADRITILCKVSCLLATHNTGSDPGNLVKFHKAFPFPVKTKSSFYLFV